MQSISEIVNRPNKCLLKHNVPTPAFFIQRKILIILHRLHCHQQTEIPKFLTLKKISLCPISLLEKVCENCRKIIKSGKSALFVRREIGYAIPCCTHVYSMFQEMALSMTSDFLLAPSSNNPYHRELVFLFVGMKYSCCQDVNPGYMIPREVFKTVIFVTVMDFNDFLFVNMYMYVFFTWG